MERNPSTESEIDTSSMCVFRSSRVSDAGEVSGSAPEPDSFRRTRQPGVKMNNASTTIERRNLKEKECVETFEIFCIEIKNTVSYYQR
jgi:hypothetical protein